MPGGLGTLAFKLSIMVYHSKLTSKVGQDINRNTLRNNGEFRLIYQSLPERTQQMQPSVMTGECVLNPGGHVSVCGERRDMSQKLCSCNKNRLPFFTKSFDDILIVKPAVQPS